MVLHLEDHLSVTGQNSRDTLHGLEIIKLRTTEGMAHIDRILAYLEPTLQPLAIGI
jgi:hypothetical protein